MYSTNLDPYQYLDYRLFLKDVVSDLKNRGLFSHRKFNRSCGFGSPNFVQLIIQGKRNLSGEAADQIAKSIGLSKKKKEFFCKLVDVNQTKDESERLKRIEWLFKEPQFLSAHQLTELQFNYYRLWYNVSIRELVLINPNATPDWISKTLSPQISIEEATQAFEILESIGFIKRHEGHWVSVSNVVFSGNNLINASVIEYHKQMLELAKRSIQEFRGHEREVSCATVAMSKDVFEEAQRKIRDLQQEIMLLNENDQSEKRLYQFNFQLFPLTTSLGDGK